MDSIDDIFAEDTAVEQGTEGSTEGTEPTQAQTEPQQGTEPTEPAADQQEGTAETGTQQGQEATKTEEVLTLSPDMQKQLNIRGGFTENQPTANSALASVAAAMGVSEAEAPAAMEQFWLNQNRLQQEREVQALLEKGFDEESARGYVQLKAEKEQRKAQEQQAAAVAEAERQKNAEMDAELQLYHSLFPDVKEFSVEERGLMEQGFNPIEAGLLCENKRLQEQLKGLNRSAENKKNAVGSAAGNAEGGDDGDEFWKGFASAF